MEDKGDPEQITLMVSVDVDVTDSDALRAYAVSTARSPEEITMAMADSSSISAILLAVDGVDFLGPIPGVTEQNSRTSAYRGHSHDTDEPDRSENQFEETRIMRKPRLKFVEDSAEGMIEAAKQVIGLREGMHEASTRLVKGYRIMGGEEDPAPEDIPAVSPRQAEIIAGVLWQASVGLIGDLFDDLEILSGENGNKSVKDMGGKSIALNSLPAIYDDRYDREFTRLFITVCHDVSMMLVTGWRASSCPAQDLAIACLQDHAEAHVKDTPIEAELPWYWMDILTEMMTEGGDVGLLTVMSPEEFDREHLPENSPVRFDNWFKPYGPEGRLPPYAKYWGHAEIPDESSSTETPPGE